MVHPALTNTVFFIKFVIIITALRYMEEHENKNKGRMKPYGYYMLICMLLGAGCGAVLRNISVGLVLGLLGGIIYYNVLRKRNGADRGR